MRHEVRIIYVPVEPGANVQQIVDCLNEGFDMLACIPVSGTRLGVTSVHAPVQAQMLAYTFVREWESQEQDSEVKRGRKSKSNSEEDIV